MLKHGDSFVFDTHGDITQKRPASSGCITAARVFSHGAELLLGRRRPLLLNSMISEQRGVHGQSDEPGYPARRPHHRVSREIHPALARPVERRLQRTHSNLQSFAPLRSRCLSRFISMPITPTCSKREVERPRQGRRLRTVAVREPSSAMSATMVSSGERLFDGVGSRTSWRKGRRSFSLRSIGMRERNWNGALAARSTAPLRSRITSSMPWHGPSGEWLTPRSRSVSFRARTRPSIDGCGGRRPTCA